jgi:purine-binding chemotaxis protein CheW
MTRDTNISKVLKERARALQTNIDNEEVITQKMDTLEFMLSDERYAIDATYVSEVITIKDLTPLPCTPSFILGIINNRGQILSVIDIKKFFNLPERGITNLNRVIIVKHQEIDVGILTDEIVGSSTVDLEALQNKIPSANKIADSYILGLTNERLIVLDITEVLQDEKIVVNEIV